MHVDAVNANEGSVTITWHLRTSHEPLKGKILNDAEKLGKEELLAFMLGAVLGDGWADVAKLKINGRVYNEAVVKITMSGEKFERWRPLFERLKGMGFSWRSEPVSGGVIDVRFRSSFAIDLARAMINVLPTILRDVLDALGFDKWVRIKRIAEMEVRWRKGEMQIIVADYKFTVNVRDDTVELVHRAGDEIEVKNIIDALRARYGDEFAVHVHKSGEKLAIKIPMYVFERYEDIKEQVIEVLCRKLEKTKDEKKKQTIIKHLKRLTPTKRATAVECPEDFTSLRT